MAASFLASLWIAAIGAMDQPAPAKVTAETLSDAHIRIAIDAIVEELYARKHPQRFWEPAKTPAGESARQAGGYTAIVTLALLHAGQSYQDPRLSDAIEYLEKTSMEGSYAIAARASVWARLPARFRPQLEADAKWLIDSFASQVGSWDYASNPKSKRTDNSIRQFGALALWEAAKRGIKIDVQLWQQLEAALIDMQLADGGWNYLGQGPATGSMTAAGLATLFITQDLLHSSEALAIAGRTSKASAPPRHQQAIEKAIQWMDKHFSSATHPGGKSAHFFYYLYAVERAALASGYARFAGQDWYRQGAVETLERIGKWNAAGDEFDVTYRKSGGSTADLAFALLFLSRGRVAVAINKLRFDGPWNNRPRDVANLVAWISQNSETELSWQIVDFADDPQAWLDAPLLYIASNEPLPWMRNLEMNAASLARQLRQGQRHIAAGESEEAAPSPLAALPEPIEKMRRYIGMGGTILAVNEGSGRNFAKSIEEMGTLMFPRYDWRNLPDDHWAYSLHAPVRSRRPVLRGLSNGVRDLIVLSAGDLAQSFQSRDEKLIGHFQTASNLYLYKSELNRGHPRLWRSEHAQASLGSALKEVTIVRAVHDGNWNAEPLSLQVFARWAGAQRGLSLRIVEQPLAKIAAISPPPACVIVCGIEKRVFTPEQLEAVKSYIESGGVLLFETPGGRGEFTVSAEQACESSFARPLETLHHHRIITGEGLNGAADLTRLEYRAFTSEHLGSRETMPRLRGMAIAEGKPVQVLFSREDISHALLDQPCWGISGYSPRSARDLLANIVQHAALLGENAEVGEAEAEAESDEAEITGQHE